VLLSANAQSGKATIESESRKNDARIFIAIYSKTFWLILSKGLRLARKEEED
jgi:hypothetical protein